MIRGNDVNNPQYVSAQQPLDGRDDHYRLTDSGEKWLARHEPVSTPGILSGAERTKMLTLRDTLLHTLTKAGTPAERARRSDTVTGGYGSELHWVHHERHLLHTLVNRHQKDTGGPEITLDQVHQIEQHAAGHTDYAAKFALGLAQLAFCGEWRI